MATELAVPWGVVFVPGAGRNALVAERDSAASFGSPDRPHQVLGTVPGVQHGGEAGLLGLAVDPAPPTGSTPT